MLGTRSGVYGDACGQELRIAADEELRHGGEPHDDIAHAEHDGAFEEPGKKTVDHLETLADKV